ncbi:hypothetical protein ACOME3_002397 [Neoechinorhynchus agilis]
MLDFFTIFTRGGIVLWCFQQGSEISSVSALTHFIDQGLLPGKAQVKQPWSQSNSLALQYAMDNEFDLLFVVAYQKVLQLSYIDKFLDEIQLRFRDMFRLQLTLRNFRHNYDQFANTFDTVYRSHEQAALEQSRRPQRSWEESEKSKKTMASMVMDSNGRSLGILAPIAKLVGTNGIAAQTGKGKKKKKSAKTSTSTKRVKQATVWDGMGGNEVDINSLDYTSQPSSSAQSSSKDGTDKASVQTPIRSELSSVESQKDHSLKPSFMSRLTKMISLNHVLTRQDLEPVVQKLKEHLMSKNVACDVSDQLCQSLLVQLTDRTISSFEGISSNVQKAMTDIVSQVLSGQSSGLTSSKILRDALDKRTRLIKQVAHPYTIVVCGVNGVGKSTSLSKIAHWLLANDLSVMVAACDTFRSGAVEQLRTHCKHLADIFKYSQKTIQLFDKGYGQDAANVCSQAILKAKSDGYNVVLIDTAGRMQNNEPLMRALAKLISMNNPDLVLFVGEALVGNEAVDQVVKFNRALADFCPGNQTPRLIDGIILTKFDTVDDKVGAAISMAYTTSKSIIFVGTGQTYGDLKNLSVDAVVDALLK